ncbi:MAG: YbaB/EbfC family nucleoid-associated protein [Kiritimatiellia bacterium]|jgi:DNA-binding YbaB/EbfC family protein|nr:YbaB/EbfC family nucleoid-associated protein [Kiritimatiellia bacterium]
MANVLKMMKQAASMQKEMKRIQKELAKQTVEFTNAGVTVLTRGDMTVESIDIDARVLEGANPEKLGKQITMAVNGALSAAKKKAGGEMSKLTAGSGLGDLLGG